MVAPVGENMRELPWESVLNDFVHVQRIMIIDGAMGTTIQQYKLEVIAQAVADTVLLT